MTLFLFFTFITLSFAKLQFGEDPDVNRNVTELITARGYPCEDYYALTPDGFFLSLQRIPYGKNQTKQGSKPVVFLMHGFLDASHTWVINGPSESLGFILADAGFDVWLGNNRGNIYSMQNIFYDPTDPIFWAWSFDEMARYDVPTMIHFILNTTGASTLTYIGHSQGTVQSLAAFSSNQEIASKVNLFIALAPVGYFNHEKSLVLSLLSDLPDPVVFEIFGQGGFPADNNIIHFVEKFFPTICTDFPAACYIPIFLIAGDCDPGNLNDTRLPVYASHIGGASVQDLVHFLQFARVDTFPYYNYGSAGNLLHYNSTTPPNYDLTKVNVPTAVFSGGLDGFADPADVAKLISVLPQVVYQNVQATFEHLDFVWGESTHLLVYSQIVKLAQQYSNK